MNGITLSADMFNAGATSVILGDKILGTLSTEGSKVIASPSSGGGRPLPFDRQEQAIYYLISCDKKKAATTTSKTSSNNLKLF